MQRGDVEAVTQIGKLVLQGQQAAALGFLAGPGDLIGFGCFRLFLLRFLFFRLFLFDLLFGHHRFGLGLLFFLQDQLGQSRGDLLQFLLLDLRRGQKGNDAANDGRQQQADDQDAAEAPIVFGLGPGQQRRVRVDVEQHHVQPPSTAFLFTASEMLLNLPVAQVSMIFFSS